MKYFKITMHFLLTVFLISACSSSQTDNGSDAGNTPDEHEGIPNMVSITKQQAETISLTMGKVQKKSLGSNIKVNGYLELYPQDQAWVSPFIGGNVQAIYVIEGEKVKKGQTLALLAHPDYILMQQQLQQNNTQLEYLKTEYDRKEKLYKEEISSGREYQKAKAEYFSTLAATKGLKTKLELLNLNVNKVLAGELFSAIPINTPIDGFVGKVSIKLGDFVEPAKTMFQINNSANTHVDFRVYEKDIYKIRKGQKAYFTVANKPGQLLEAQIESIGQTFEDDPKAIHIHARLTSPAAGNMIPGLYVEGRIVENEKLTNVLPEEAVVTEGSRSFVFVKVTQDEDEGNVSDHSEVKMSFKVQDVITGIRDAGFIEVSFTEPQNKDALIVYYGAYMLSSELVKSQLEHED